MLGKTDNRGLNATWFTSNSLPTVDNATCLWAPLKLPPKSLRCLNLYDSWTSKEARLHVGAALETG